MPSMTLQVGAQSADGRDDGHVWTTINTPGTSPNGISTGNGANYVGDQREGGNPTPTPLVDYHSWIRFHTTAAIPSGATITNAYITLRSTSTRTAFPTIHIHAHEQANAGLLTSQALWTTKVAERSVEYVAWTPTEWLNGVDYQSPNIAPVIQELLDNTGEIANGDGLLLFLLDASIGWNGVENRLQFAAYEVDPDLAPKLYIEWTEPSPPETYDELDIPTNAAVSLTSVETATFVEYSASTLFATMSGIQTRAWTEAAPAIIYASTSGIGTATYSELVPATVYVQQSGIETAALYDVAPTVLYLSASGLDVAAFTDTLPATFYVQGSGEYTLGYAAFEEAMIYLTATGSDSAVFEELGPAVLYLRELGVDASTFLEFSPAIAYVFNDGSAIYVEPPPQIMYSIAFTPEDNVSNRVFYELWTGPGKTGTLLVSGEAPTGAEYTTPEFNDSTVQTGTVLRYLTLCDPSGNCQEYVLEIAVLLGDVYYATTREARIGVMTSGMDSFNLFYTEQIQGVTALISGELLATFNEVGQSADIEVYLSGAVLEGWWESGPVFINVEQSGVDFMVWTDLIVEQVIAAVLESLEQPAVDALDTVAMILPVFGGFADKILGYIVRYDVPIMVKEQPYDSDVLLETVYDTHATLESIYSSDIELK